MPPKGPEYELQQQIVGEGKTQNSLASLYGWDHVHFRALRTQFGWRTPGSGTLAKGWPDLTLVRVRDGLRQIIFAELKSDTGRLTDDEKRVLAILRLFEGRYAAWMLGGVVPEDFLDVGVYVWRPRDFDQIEATMR